MPKAKIEGWRDVVYSLFYPSLLGSIIFDIFDPMRMDNYERFWASPIAFAFVFDYWHMMVDLDVENETKGFRLTLDILISLFFTLAYFLLSNVLSGQKPPFGMSKVTSYTLSLSFLAMGYVLIAVSEMTKNRYLNKIRRASLLPALICLMGLASTRLLSAPIRSITITTLTTSAVVYALFVLTTTIWFVGPKRLPKN